MSQLDLPRDGLGTRTPQIARSHDLRQAALLRARYRFARGQPRRAVDDLLALVRFARHLEPGGTLVGTLAGYAIERDAIRLLAANMWVLSPEPDVLTFTRAEWEKLPPTRPMVDALREERDGLVGMLSYHSRLDPSDIPDDELGTPIGFIPTFGFILGQETFEQSVATLGRTVRKHYDRMIQIAALPPHQVPAAEKAFHDNWNKDTANDDLIAVAVTRMLLPAGGRLRHTECEMQARRAMLRAALAVAAEGRDKLKAHPDPFGTGPFALRPVDGGYELKSDLGKVIDRPVTLPVRTTRPKP
jgi:hypothetical protein